MVPERVREATSPRASFLLTRVGLMLPCLSDNRGQGCLFSHVRFPQACDPESSPRIGQIRAPRRSPQHRHNTRPRVYGNWQRHESGLRSGSQENVDKRRAKVEAWKARFDDVEVLKSVRRHWSGYSLEWAANQVDLGSAYTTMYRYTSAFAHGSDVSAHFFVKKQDGIPTLKIAPGDDEVEAVLNSSIALLGVILESANERLGLGEGAIVERIRAETAKLNRHDDSTAGSC